MMERSLMMPWQTELPWSRYLPVLIGEHVSFLGAGEDVGEGHVGDEEAAEDLGLQPEAVQARRKESEEVLDGIFPLASLHEVPKVRHGEAC